MYIAFSQLAISFSQFSCKEAATLLQVVTQKKRFHLASVVQHCLFMNLISSAICMRMCRSRTCFLNEGTMWMAACKLVASLLQEHDQTIVKHGQIR
jgi:predicted GNAT family acetyltransferase